MIRGLRDKEEKKIQELTKTGFKWFELQIEKGGTVRDKFIGGGTKEFFNISASMTDVFGEGTFVTCMGKHTLKTFQFPTF